MDISFRTFDETILWSMRMASASKTSRLTSSTPLWRSVIGLHGPADAMTAIDWKRSEDHLMEIAGASGGRFYSPDNTIDLSGTYDDIMENLKVRYVITYKSSTHADPNVARTVRVALVSPSTGGPLQIVDANGRTLSAKVIVQDSYTPSAVSRANARS
jgi:hypothetical protein